MTASVFLVIQNVVKLTTQAAWLTFVTLVKEKKIKIKQQNANKQKPNNKFLSVQGVGGGGCGLNFKVLLRVCLICLVFWGYPVRLYKYVFGVEGGERYTVDAGTKH